jgi:tRNA A-37 threonylcarbamoyl transferase component Bud32
MPSVVNANVNPNATAIFTEEEPKIEDLTGRSIGNYLITEKLGEGGMGAVYKGEHKLIGKKVAFKFLLRELSNKPDLVQRFFNEAKAVNQVGHPNIIDITDFGVTADGYHYFVMELLEGQELSKALKGGGPMDQPRAFHIVRQAADALAASHARGIVHRDLKPDNIFLINRPGDRDFCKLLDFGIAKLLENNDEMHKTRTGMVLGTPYYMSPEQANGDEVDHRTDIYALGIIMYQMLTGRVPFTGKTFSQIMVALLTAPPEPPRNLNPQITEATNALILKAIHKDKNQRFQTMREFLDALNQAAMGFMPQGMMSGMGTGSYPMMAGQPHPYFSATPLPGFTGTPHPSFVGTPQPGMGGTPVPGYGMGVPGTPTTMRSSVGEVVGPARQSKAGIFIAAGVAAVVAAGGVIGFLVLAGPNKKPRPVASVDEDEGDGDRDRGSSGKKHSGKSGPEASDDGDSSSGKSGKGPKAKPVDEPPPPETSAPTTAAPPPATSAPREETAKVVFGSKPDGAVVTDAAGKTLGTTPFTLDLPIGDELNVTFKSGKMTAKKTFTVKKGGLEVSVTLKEPGKPGPKGGDDEFKLLGAPSGGKAAPPPKKDPKKKADLMAPSF